MLERRFFFYLPDRFSVLGSFGMLYILLHALFLQYQLMLFQSILGVWALTMAVCDITSWRKEKTEPWIEVLAGLIFPSWLQTAVTLIRRQDLLMQIPVYIMTYYVCLGHHAGR